MSADGNAGAHQHSNLPGDAFFAHFFAPKAASNFNMPPDGPLGRVEDGRLSTRVVVSGNRLFNTKTELFNSRHDSRSIEGAFDDNYVYGGSVNVANGGGAGLGNEAQDDERGSGEGVRN
ncbi:MAG: hypothetical protein M1821_008936 [Bathelium mastoideum]|nr:MAG: hypothetical protein M1821_008936 [Bathelium mastoideum]